MLASRAFAALVLLTFLASAPPASALAPQVADDAPGIALLDDGRRPDYVMAARDTVDLEEHGGWTGEYIFGMTKGVMRSTLTPALKPVVLLLTVPLDLAFLPFAAIGGFFR